MLYFLILEVRLTVIVNRFFVKEIVARKGYIICKNIKYSLIEI